MMLQQANVILALIVISSSEILASIISANECINHTTLNEATRSRFFSNQSTVFSDRSLTGWFTFNGSSGTQIANSCVATSHCGTLAPGWMPGVHPRAEEGVVERSACFSGKQLCCMESASMLVRNCSGFYVYKLDSMPSFKYSFRFCGAGVEGSQQFLKGGSNKTSDNTAAECLNYKRLNERDRAADYFSYHKMKCDANLPEAWYRFTGRAGAVMPTKCVPKLHCGTLSPGWLNGKHPTVGEGMVERMVCFTKDDDCCFWYSRVMVRNCSDFIVYRFGQFPALQHLCGLRYCGAGKEGCTDKDGNIYEVHQTWNPNPLVTCECTPDFKVDCSKFQDGCWDEHGKAYVNGLEWLANSTTKCTCSNEKISCADLSRPACTDENGVVREHGTNWFPLACFNCSCTDGVVSCIKYHVTVQYGLFRIKAVGNCMPCRRPRDDIYPTGNGTVSNCQVFFQLKNSDALFHCSNRAFVRKSHLCNGISECSDGSDEAGCNDVICRDEVGQVLILKETWKVTKCLECKCVAGFLRCRRSLQVNFPGMRNAYVPLTETCEQPGCNTVEFIRDRRHACEAIETTMGGRIRLEGEAWEFQGCRFQFTGQRMTTGCPNMIGLWCHVYNGAICCAKKCPALPELASQLREKVSVCPGGLQLAASDDKCDPSSPNCLQDNDPCKAGVTCRDEKGFSYFEGATWTVGDCITCRCNNSLISCTIKRSFITSGDEIIQHCIQPKCNVVAFLKSHAGICKACTWKNQTFLDGYRWKENGVDFFCTSDQRVRPGCYLYRDKIDCTGAFTGIQNLKLISDEELFLCESGDEVRSLNDRCNKVKDCYDASDEKDCVQYFCPAHTKFNLKWNRTVSDNIVYRNCSEVNPSLGGSFGSRCTQSFYTTKWHHKESCDCEKETLLQQFGTPKLSTANLTNLAEITRELTSKALNFTNKRLFFGYLKELFDTGVRLLSPINQENDVVASYFSRVMFFTAGNDDIFTPPSGSFCPETVSSSQRRLFQFGVKKFTCQASNLTHSFMFCQRLQSPFGWVTTKAKQLPSYRFDEKRPGLTVFWQRPVLRLKIDSSQLTSGDDLPDSIISHLPRNNTSEGNGSDVLRRRHVNCSWVEYDVNGTLKIRVSEVKDDEKEQKAFIQGYLELGLSSISVLAVITSLVILSCLRIRNSERIFVHKNLMLSLCLVYIVMIFDTFVFTNRKQTPKLCSTMAVIQHLTHLSVFTWMLVEGIHLYIKLVKVFSVRKLYITYILIGWGLPLVIVGLIAAVRPKTYDMSKIYYKDVICGSLKIPAEIIRDRCWLHDGEWLYKGPILAILLVNVAIFVVLLRVIFTKISIKYQADNLQIVKRGMKSVAALLPLLGVTWLLGFVVHFSEVLLYLFIILNSTQGLLFCIFHSLLDDQIRESLIRSFRRSRTDHLARCSIASTSTQLSPMGSLSGKEVVKQRQSIQASTGKPYETKL